MTLPCLELFCNWLSFVCGLCGGCATLCMSAMSVSALGLRAVLQLFFLYQNNIITATIKIKTTMPPIIKGNESLKFDSLSPNLSYFILFFLVLCSFCVCICVCACVCSLF